MNDKKRPEEEELFEDLDNMYRRVADTDDETILIPPSHPEEEEKKRPARTFIIVGCIVFVILATIFVITLVEPTFFSGPSKTPGDQPLTVTAPSSTPESPAAVATKSEPSEKPEAADTDIPPPAASDTTETAAAPPPARLLMVEKKPDIGKTVQKEETKEESPSQQIAKPDRPLPPAKYYAVQVGAFSNMNNVRRIVDAFNKEGLEAHWMTVKSSDGKIIHRVFVGQFANKSEAAHFLKSNKMLKKYPGSFVKEVSVSQVKI
ncbi:MAG: SPOR domain-containing protein [Deltaproteobacteria bacterium]|nr:SPOR domain-containing protein [Deltaproteobacteria bacterium]